jgi:AcrR family transcriptional regulator
LKSTNPGRPEVPSTTRHRGRNVDRRSVVEAQILAATEQLLREGENFTDLGVQRIAAVAGVARSSFYVSFRDKTELLIRLAGGLKQQIFDLAEDWRPTGPGGGLDGLTAVYVAMIAFYREHPQLLAAISEVAAYDSTVADFWTAQLDRFTDLTARLLREEQAAGRTTADFDPAIVAQILTWDGDRVIARHIADADHADGTRDAAVAREIALIRWHGAYRRPSSRPAANTDTPMDRQQAHG